MKTTNILLKWFLLLVLGATYSLSRGQTVEKLINEIKLPKGWRYEIDRDTSEIREISKLRILSVTFYHKKESIQITYDAYFVTREELSKFLIEKTFLYQKCADTSLIRFDEKSFYMWGFFFVMKKCPCDTTNVKCAELVTRLKEWEKENQAD